MQNEKKVEVNQNENKPRGIRGLFAKCKARTAVMVAALCSFMSIGAFADDGTGGASASGGFDAVLASFDTLGQLMSKVWGLMTANPYLTLFLAVALLGIGVTVFNMIKGAANP